MTYTTVEGVLHPDGTVSLPPDQLPKAPVRVMVTLLEDADAAPGPAEGRGWPPGYFEQVAGAWQGDFVEVPEGEEEKREEL